MRRSWRWSIKQAQLAHHVKSLGLEAPFYTSVEQMLDRTEVDAVFVCTPAAAHLPTARACVERGVHVFVEKPLADTLENARRMVRPGQGHARVVHAVGYMKSHYPLYQKMRALVQGGTLGRIHQCHCTLYLSQVFRPPKGWVYSKDTSGGGIIINSTCHLLLLLQWFFGDVSGVFARAAASIRRSRTSRPWCSSSRTASSRRSTPRGRCRDTRSSIPRC